jgi:hypothetical protein
MVYSTKPCGGNWQCLFYGCGVSLKMTLPCLFVNAGAY